MALKPPAPNAPLLLKPPLLLPLAERVWYILTVFSRSIKALAQAVLLAQRRVSGCWTYHLLLLRCLRHLLIKLLIGQINHRDSTYRPPPITEDPPFISLTPSPKASPGIPLEANSGQSRRSSARALPPGRRLSHRRRRILRVYIRLSTTYPLRTLRLTPISRSQSAMSSPSPLSAIKASGFKILSRTPQYGVTR